MAPRSGATWPPSARTISAITWSARMRMCAPMSCTGRCRLPRCQAMRTRSAGVVGVDVEQGLGLGDDTDHPAALEQQPVAVAQPGGLRQVEQQLLPGFGPQRKTAAVPAVEVDQDPAALVLLLPRPGRQDLSRAHSNAAGSPASRSGSRTRSPAAPRTCRRTPAYAAASATARRSGSAPMAARR